MVAKTRQFASRGFSLVELLVVLVILIVILALLLPAIQQVRISAANAKCQNNLHQLGLAFHTWWLDKSNGEVSPGSWETDLAPYHEHVQKVKICPMSFDRPGGLADWKWTFDAPVSGVIELPLTVDEPLSAYSASTGTVWRWGGHRTNVNNNRWRTWFANTSLSYGVVGQPYKFGLSTDYGWPIPNNIYQGNLLCCPAEYREVTLTPTSTGTNVNILVLGSSTPTNSYLVDPLGNQYPLNPGMPGFATSYSSSSVAPSRTTDYGMNADVRRDRLLRRSSSLFLFMDYISPLASHTTFTANVPVNRHRPQNINVAFGDGHVESRRVSDTSPNTVVDGSTVLDLHWLVQE
jgi:prepilin-type N-terminal cleavage/methylation domain-containing protein/prepilin-type processing-associated H-X9-DG protein